MKSKMMERMNKYLAYILLLGFIVFGTKVLAVEKPLIMETYTGDSSISIYVKGGEKVEDTTTQIGTVVCTDVEGNKLSETGTPFRTLIMVDNSLSIPEAMRGQVAEVLHNLIADRGESEEIAIATFDENINYLAEYSSDYTTLKAAVDSIEYQDLETYLTDVLYDLISTEYIGETEDVYRRIIVISDGVDNKSIGYTKDELYTLLREHSIPIYTVGIKDGKNNEQLENMFALSRMTNADDFILNDMEDILDINTCLNQDRDIIRYVIKPDVGIMDGSKKVVRIVYESGQNISAEIVMPQQEQIIKEEEKAEIQEEPAVEEKPVQESESKDNIGAMIYLIIGVCFAVVIAGIIVVVVFVIRKRTKKSSFEIISDDVLIKEQQERNDDEKTELVGSFSRLSDDGTTFMMWNSNTTYNMILTDIHSPVKSFQAPLQSSIVIGRKKDMCGITIDYDKSVSGRHCEIKVKDGRFYIDDLQSSNGTFVNDCKVLSEIEIFSGNIIKLGRLEFKFEVR